MKVQSLQGGPSCTKGKTPTVSIGGMSGGTGIVYFTLTSLSSTSIRSIKAREPAAQGLSCRKITSQMHLSKSAAYNVVITNMSSHRKTRKRTQ